MSNTEKKAPLHIVITNNTTGETYIDEDFTAIIGGIAIDLAGTAKGLSILNGPLIALASAIKSAELAIEGTEDENPDVYIARMMIDTIVEEKQTRSKKLDEEEKGE